MGGAIAALILADGGEPAGGASASEILWGSIGALLIFSALGLLGVLHRSGRTKTLTNLGAFSERVTGLPAWCALPVAVAGGALVMAAFGFYWDVATHIDDGRDPGPFANPSHYFIIFGLLGIATAGYLGVLLGTPATLRTSLRIKEGWHAPVGAILLIVCGGIAVMGFPLDDVWHRLFGQDVTLWGPTHIQMVGGAALSTLALWVLFSEGRRGATEPQRPIWRALELTIAGAFLVGVSALQAEFDYSVPQFRMLFHPVLLALSAGLALVPARIRLGRGGALIAVAFFLGLRGLLSLIIGPGFGHTTLHFPLYLAEALLVELVALRVSTDRQVTFGVWSGLAIGTVGVAAEWVWSRIGMPFGWSDPLLPEIWVATVAGVAGGVVGGLIGRALGDLTAPKQSLPRFAAAFATLGVVFALVYPLPISADVQGRATVTLDNPEAASTTATIEFDPPHLAAEPLWLNVTSWQGGGSRIAPLEPVGGGVYRSSAFPISGSWKSLIRLHTGSSIVAVPLYLPEDPAIPAEEVPATARFTRDFVQDKKILLREAKDTPAWMSWVGYSLLGLIVVIWISILAWGAARMDKNGSVGRGGPRFLRRVLHPVG
ncbi:MAG: hypothetical protein ACLGIB_01330 [Actinomycetota bacterium]